MKKFVFLIGIVLVMAAFAACKSSKKICPAYSNIETEVNLESFSK